jgi:hypothetical protein
MTLITYIVLLKPCGAGFKIIATNPDSAGKLPARDLVMYLKVFDDTTVPLQL